MFGACRRLMNPGGCTIVALAGLPPQQTFVQHSTALIPAAQQAGLGWLQHIVAITAPIVGSSPPPVPPRPESPASSPCATPCGTRRARSPPSATTSG
ncbi:hypothetical protein [Dactylosporangium sp. CA-139066]|uniref:hypothetical protein n=1 Tax=Dactylosporangium sp. CA-139066 TaxID=3239930 RepID=UPI003D8D03C0